MADWFFLSDGKQVGPIGDADFSQLVASGRVTPETYVWRGDLPDWVPYRSLAPGLQSPTSGPDNPASGETGPRVACSQCGGLFKSDEVIPYRDLWVCASCKPLFFQRLREGARPANLLEYAGILSRLAADILDGLIVFVPFMFLFMLAGGVMAVAAQGRRGEPGGVFFLVIVMLELGMFVFWAFYQIWFVGKYGATLGKRIVKIKIVTSEGEPVSYGRATGRFFAEMLSGMTFYIGYLIAFFDEQKRTLHDRICDTLVIKV